MKKVGIFTGSSQYGAKILSYRVDVKDVNDVTQTPEWKAACSVYRFVSAKELNS